MEGEATDPMIRKARERVRGLISVTPTQPSSDVTEYLSFLDCRRALFVLLQ